VDLQRASRPQIPEYQQVIVVNDVLNIKLIIIQNKEYSERTNFESTNNQLPKNNYPFP
jgi:hypothetical protein